MDYCGLTIRRKIYLNNEENIIDCFGAYSTFSWALCGFFGVGSHVCVRLEFVFFFLPYLTQPALCDYTRWTNCNLVLPQLPLWEVRRDKIKVSVGNLTFFPFKRSGSSTGHTWCGPLIPLQMWFWEKSFILSTGI